MTPYTAPPQGAAHAAAHSPVFLTEHELAQRWKRTTMTLQRMRKDGRLPFVRIGKSPRYRLADIERLESNGAA